MKVNNKIDSHLFSSFSFGGGGMGAIGPISFSAPSVSATRPVGGNSNSSQSQSHAVAEHVTSSAVAGAVTGYLASGGNPAGAGYGAIAGCVGCHTSNSINDSASNTFSNDCWGDGDGGDGDCGDGGDDGGCGDDGGDDDGGC